jgi:hypothetical protein
MSVMMIAITGNGSLLRYGICAWYVDALFDALLKNDGLASASLPAIDEGREVAILLEHAPHSDTERKEGDTRSDGRKREFERIETTKLVRQILRMRLLPKHRGMQMTQSGASSCYRDPGGVISIVMY